MAAPPAGGLKEITKAADPDAGLASHFPASPHTRAAVAANPTLPARHVAALARDPDTMHARQSPPGGTPVRKHASRHRSSTTTGAARSPPGYWTPGLSGPDLLAFTRSRHQIFRKTLAQRPDLPDEITEILAPGESLAVRLFTCERQPNAPGWLLAQVAAQWASYSLRDMLAHNNFPADAATRLAHSDESSDRAVAAAHPGLAANVIEALLAHDNDSARRQAAPNPPFHPPS